MDESKMGKQNMNHCRPKQMRLQLERHHFCNTKNKNKRKGSWNCSETTLILKSILR